MNALPNIYRGCDWGCLQQKKFSYDVEIMFPMEDERICSQAGVFSDTFVARIGSQYECCCMDISVLHYLFVSTSRVSGSGVESTLEEIKQRLVLLEEQNQESIIE